MLLRHERDAGYHARLEQTFAGAGAHSAVMASAVFGMERVAELNTLFGPHVRGQDRSLSFVLGPVD